MRVVHTCLRYPPATGGVETYVREIVERTRLHQSSSGQVGEQDSLDVRVLTSSMRTHGPITPLKPELILDDPMYVQRLHHMATPFISYPRLQALSYYIGHHQPDILHSYSFWYQPADGTARYAKQHNIPFIFHPMFYENEVRRKPLWQLYKHTIGRRTFAAADVVAVISPHEQALIEKAQLPVKRFALLPPGVDMSRFDHPRLDPFIKRGIKGPILLMVSRVAHGKGIDEAISVLPEITKEHTDVQLVVAGEDFGARSSLIAQAEQLGVRNRLHFLGKVDEAELIGAYQHATIFIHSSHYEAFGIVVAEALAAQLPVVARNTAAIPFVAPHEVGSLLFKTSAELIAGILQLLGSEPFRKKLGLTGRHHIEDNFSWDDTVDKILTLYEELRPRQSKV